MEQPKTTAKINEGPNLHQILTSVGHQGKCPADSAIDMGKATAVSFTLKFAESETPAVVFIAISGLDREDGSGMRWIIRGYILHNTNELYSRVEGYYDIKTRTGHMNLFGR